MYDPELVRQVSEGTDAERVSACRTLLDRIPPPPVLEMLYDRLREVEAPSDELNTLIAELRRRVESPPPSWVDH